MKESDSVDEAQKSQDGGGIRPAKGGGGSKPGGSASGDDKLRNEAMANGPMSGVGMARTVSTAGKATSRGTTLEACEQGVPSGKSDIDPGGKRYASKRSSSDQD